MAGFSENTPAPALGSPFSSYADEPMSAGDPVSADDQLLGEAIQARIGSLMEQVMEYHRTHRPPNTARSYDPKQEEWKVSLEPLPCCRC